MKKLVKLTPQAKVDIMMGELKELTLTVELSAKNNKKVQKLIDKIIKEIENNY